MCEVTSWDRCSRALLVVSPSHCWGGVSPLLVYFMICVSILERKKITWCRGLEDGA